MSIIGTIACIVSSPSLYVLYREKTTKQYGFPTSPLSGTVHLYGLDRINYMNMDPIRRSMRGPFETNINI